MSQLIVEIHKPNQDSETVRISDYEISKDGIGNDLLYLYSPSSAIQLATAIIEECGEWLPIEDAPEREDIWLSDGFLVSHGKLVLGHVFHGISIVCDFTPTHYQPLIKPKA